jgi:DNA-binding GntR family transcriptional regulator
MKELVAQPRLVEQVQDAILAEIAEGRLAAGERVIQEQIAQGLGVSRQPVQQALLLLRDKGVLREAPGRGLIVSPVDLGHVRDVYEVRAVLEGLAFRKAAETNAERARTEGPALIQAGRKAARSGSVAAMVRADRDFHDFVCDLSGNALISPALDSQWIRAQRLMGEALIRDERPRDVWDQHAAMLDEVIAGRPATAERMARQHVLQAGDFVLARLQEPVEPARRKPGRAARVVAS